MKQLPADTILKRKIKLVRETMDIKQGTVADALKMTAGNYNKIESGSRKMTPGQLVIIAKEIKTSAAQLLFISDEDVDEFKFFSLSRLIVKLCMYYNGHPVVLTDEEVKFLDKVVENNKKYYP